MRVAAAITFTLLLNFSWSTPVSAQQAMTCTGPTTLPAGGMQGPFCHNGRMGFASTEFVPLTEASNIPKKRALIFARKEAEMKARSAMARFLSELSVTEVSIASDGMIESSERNAWMNFINTTSIQTVRARLQAGIAVIASDVVDDMIFVTVATTPDMKDLVSSISNYRSEAATQSAPASSPGSSDLNINPFSTVPKNVAPW